MSKCTGTAVLQLVVLLELDEPDTQYDATNMLRDCSGDGLISEHNWLLSDTDLFPANVFVCRVT